MKMIIILGIMGIVLVAIIIQGEFKISNCFDRCYENPSQIQYANSSGHGIMHVCSDECMGGVNTRRRILTR